MERKQVYPCGCAAFYCLCGCDNEPGIRDCRAHKNAEEVLKAAQAVLDAWTRANIGPIPVAVALALRKAVEKSN